MKREFGRSKMLKERHLISVGYSESVNYSTGDIRNGYTVYVMDIEDDYRYEFVGDKNITLFNNVEEAMEAGNKLAKVKYGLAS